MRRLTEEEFILKALDEDRGLASRSVAKSITGLVIVVSLLVIGMSHDDSRAFPDRMAAAEPAPRVGSASEQHRRMVFDARRAEYEQHSDAHKLASSARRD